MASSINSVFEEFREQSPIKDVFINKNVTSKKFEIKLQCTEKKMDMADKVRHLKKLCLKHGIDWICCPWDINFLVKKKNKYKTKL